MNNQVILRVTAGLLCGYLCCSLNAVVHIKDVNDTLKIIWMVWSKATKRTSYQKWQIKLRILHTLENVFHTILTNFVRFSERLIIDNGTTAISLVSFLYFCFCRFVHGGERFRPGIRSEGSLVHAHPEGEWHPLHRLSLLSIQPRWSQPRHTQCLCQGVCSVCVWMTGRERVDWHMKGLMKLEHVNKQTHLCSLLGGMKLALRH